MGSCVSRSPASAAWYGRAVATTKTAKVIGLDGSMAQYAAPVTAREAMADAARSSSFLCSSDELRFDQPARALAADEALQPGWLYFVLPVPMLRRPLSGQEMAALAVRASSALAAAGGLTSPSRRKNGAVAAGANGKRRKVTARVAPLVVLSSSDDEGEHDVGWSHHASRKYGTPETVRGHAETVGKTRKGAGYRSRRTRRHGGVQRLSAILEADDDP